MDPITESAAPAEPSADTAFQDAGEAFIRETEAEFRAALNRELDAELGLDAADPSPSSTPQASASPGEAPPPAPPAPPPAADPPEIAAGLQKLVARETELAVRERQVADLERQRTAYERELAQLRQQAQSIEQLRARFSTDPVAAMTAIGVDPTTAVHLVLAQRMGDKAPPELRQALQEARRDAEIRELREQLQRRDAETAQNQYWSQVSAAADQHLASDLAATPTVAALKAAAPDRARAELVEVIRQDAQRRIAAGEDLSAPIMSFQEAAKVLESRYSWARAQGAPPTTPALQSPPPVAPAASTQAPTTSAGTGTTPPQSPKTAPAAPKAPRPLMPWQANSQKELEEAGIRAALAEYRKAEQAR